MVRAGNLLLICISFVRDLDAAEEPKVANLPGERPRGGGR
jgi:hypothetical protein